MNLGEAAVQILICGKDQSFCFLLSHPKPFVWDLKLLNSNEASASPLSLALLHSLNWNSNRNLLNPKSSLWMLNYFQLRSHWTLMTLQGHKELPNYWEVSWRPPPGRTVALVANRFSLLTIWWCSKIKIKSDSNQNQDKLNLCHSKMFMETSWRL